MKEKLWQLQQLLQQLWQEQEVPVWHRRLYLERFCTGDYPPEVLSREIKALKKGTALVQQVQDAIANREEVLMRLIILRTAYEDSDFITPGNVARCHLFEQLDELRTTTLLVVEAICSWRLSVALRPGKLSGDPQANSSGFAGSVARGAQWPYAGPTADFEEAESGEDYLLRVARDDMVVRSFESVLHLADDADPFLYNFSVGGTGPLECGKLCPPPTESVDSSRLDAARMRLMEEELSLVVFQPSSMQSNGYGSSMTPLMRALTAHLQLPSLNETSPVGSTEDFGDEEGFGDSAGSVNALRRFALKEEPSIIPLSPENRPSMIGIGLGLGSLPEIESVFGQSSSSKSSGMNLVGQGRRNALPRSQKELLPQSSMRGFLSKPTVGRKELRADKDALTALEDQNAKTNTFERDAAHQLFMERMGSDLGDLATRFRRVATAKRSTVAKGVFGRRGAINT